MTEYIACYSMQLTDAQKRDFLARQAQAETLVNFGFAVVGALRRIFARRPVVTPGNMAISTRDIPISPHTFTPRA